MDRADESDSLFDSSADLFDDSDTEPTMPVCEAARDTHSRTNIDNKATQVGSQPQGLQTSRDTIQSIGVKESSSSQDRVTFLDRDVEKTNKEHFNSNLHNQPAYVNDTSLDDSFESHPNKRHKLCEYMGGVSDCSYADLTIHQHMADFHNSDISNPSDKVNICTVEDNISEYRKNSGRNVPKPEYRKNSDRNAPKLEYRKNSDRNVPKLEYRKNSDRNAPKLEYRKNSDKNVPKLEYRKNSDRNAPKLDTNFCSSFGSSSLNENVEGNKLCRNVDSKNEKEWTATNSDSSAMTRLSQLSLHQGMITDACSQDVEGQTCSNETSNMHTPDIPQASLSPLPKPAQIICPFCNIQQDSLNSMEIHIDSMHSETPNDNSEQGAMLDNNLFEDSDGYDIEFVCPFCDLDLGDRVTLDLHLLAIHEEEHNVPAGEQETCPLCGLTSISEDSMKQHIQTHSSDPTVFGISENDHGTEASTTAGAMVCPICGVGMTDSDLLISHVESHFNSKHSAEPDLTAGTSSRQNTSKEDAKLKVSAADQRDLSEYQKKIQAKPTVSQKNVSSTSRDKPTPNGSRENISYKRQYEQNLERAVTKGQMSVADYHEQKLLMAETDLAGVDNGSTRTPGLVEKLELLYRSQARRGQVAYFCSPTDHFCGSFGDKGWGCGYRNFQMLLSCLARNDGYSQRIFADKNLTIPSIPKIQQMIETAWRKGFDVQGCGQFGGRLVNTNRWIGATEIVATLSSMGIKSLLVDFHAPTAPDGTHPHLLDWVSDHFSTHQQAFIPPLYLQHQGHSRTIVGVEKDCGVTKLLIFDPGTPRDQIGSVIHEQLSWKHMRTFRRTLAGFKAKQYQIIAILGLLTEEEYQESKILKSVQVS